jgi:hypothetical protein
LTRRVPTITAEAAERIATTFLNDQCLSVGKLIAIRNREPVFVGREDGKCAGSWEISYESTTRKMPTDRVICPDPQAPIVVEVDDRSGTPRIWGRL